MQFLRLNESCRMICYSILSNNMSTLLKLGFSGYDVNHGFVRSDANISYKIHFFIGEKILMALDTYAKKNNPPSIVLGGGCTVRSAGS